MNRYFILFCSKVLFFLLLIILIDYSVGFTFKKIKGYGLEMNPENMWLKTAFVVEKVDADVLIIGSSKASHHYVPDLLSNSLGMTVYNCGQDGCFYLYQNCIINMILDRYSPKMIIWDIQPDCFDATSVSNEYQNIRYMSPYYENNEWVKKYINSESKTTSLKMKSKMFAYNSKVFNYIFPLVARNSKTEKGYIPLPITNENQPLFEKLTSEKEDYIANEKKLKLLANTMKRCAEKGVELKLVVSPEYRDKPFTFMAAIEDIRKISQQYDIQFEDYSSNEEFMKNAVYFKDVMHLNDKGARELCAKLVKHLLIDNI